MKNMTIHLALIASGCALCLSGCDTRDDASATQNSEYASDRDAQTTPDRDTQTTRADNTGNNRDDLGQDARTPLDQSQSSEHIKLTADIRQAVIADDTLSAGAKNCKIITDKSGRVWLRGAVDSQAEKDLIERIARQYAGSYTVINELEFD